MNPYQNILVALDIFADYTPVLEKALKIARSPASLSLLYVSFPQMYFESYGVPVADNFVHDNRASAQAKLLELASNCKTPATQIYVRVGDPAAEIHALADKIDAELIVMGTHGQSGLKLLLGSTANGVLHGVKCDVLAIKI